MKRLLLIVFVFLFIYMPLFDFPFNILHLLAIISYLYILNKYYYLARSTLKHTGLKIFILYHIISIFFVLFLFIFFSGDILYSYRHFLIVFEIIPISIFISFQLIKLKFDKYAFYNFILLIGVIQVGIVLITFLYPTVRYLIMEKYMSTNIEERFSIVSGFRAFGLSRNYMYAMPLFQGLCIIIAVILGMFKSKIYYFLIPLYVFSIALNARIGLFSLVVVSIVLFLSSRRGAFYTKIFSVLIILISIYFFAEYVKTRAVSEREFTTWVWLDRGFQELPFLGDGRKEGVISTLSTMWFLPDIEYFIFGTGHIPFHQKVTQNSDIGYVQIFFYGGIIYSLLVYMAYITITIDLVKKSPAEEKVLFMSILLYLLLVNIKGFAFNSGEHINGIILIYVFTIISSKLNSQSRNLSMTHLAEI